MEGGGGGVGQGVDFDRGGGGGLKGDEGRGNEELEGMISSIIGYTKLSTGFIDPKNETFHPIPGGISHPACGRVEWGDFWS